MRAPFRFVWPGRPGFGRSPALPLVDSPEVSALRAAGWLLFGLGAALRIVAYATRPVLWSDEAALAMNIVDRELAQVARPFVHQQAAPYLFMIGEKLLSLVLGASEYSLRLWSLSAGIALLPALHRLSAALAGRLAGVLALLICAPSELLVYYSSELKPYANDALVSTGLLLLGLPLVATMPERGRAYLPLAAAGVLAPWLSLPSVFVLAAIGSALAVAGHDHGRSRQLLLTLVAIALVWIASFGLHHALFLQRTDADAARVQAYWQAQGGFPVFPPHALGDLRWYGGKFAHTFGLLVVPVGHGLRYVAAAFWLFGVGLMFRRARSLALMFALPFVLVWAAAAARLYVVTDRLILFMAPVAIAPAVLGLCALAARAARARVAYGVALALLCAAASASALPTLRWLQRPRPTGDIRTLVAQLVERIEPHDRLFIAGNVAWVYAYYANRAGLDHPFVQTDALASDPRLAEPVIASLGRAPRVWAVVGALGPALSRNPNASATIAATEQHILQQFSRRGRELAWLDGSNVRAYLFDLSAGSGDPR